jgi:uncharacterized SAM-binding protein YcdF (DUF218 family)
VDNRNFLLTLLRGLLNREQYCMPVVTKLIFCLGLLGIADSVLIVAIRGGVSLGTLLPGATGILFIVWGFFRPRTGLDFTFLHQWGIKTFAFILFCCWAFSFLLVQVLILWHAFGNKTAETDWCILLGAGLRGDRPTLTLKCRIDTAAAYLTKHPKMRVVVSGGQGPGESITEAEAMRRGLVQGGVDPARILLEDKSTSTAENLRYSRDVIKKAGGNDAALVSVISSDFHLFRVGLLAHRQGLQVCLVPARTPWYLLPNTCGREYFALIKSVILDR